MKKTLSMLLSGAMAVPFVLGAVACAGKIDAEAPAFDAPDATYYADFGAETVDISDTLFGVFLEDINYASYALDANMVANGSFESTHNAPKNYAWAPIDATLTVENTEGPLSDLNETYQSAQTNPNYAKVEIKAAGGGLSNKGYDAVPFAAEKGVKYVFSAFIKSAEDLKLTVELKSKKTTCFSGEISIGGGNEWIKYSKEFKANETADKDLSLDLCFNAPATVYVDGVTLETQDSTLGIKQYLYDAIEGLAPKFIRFPGGCIVEGNGYINKDGTSGLAEGAYDWKNSIGAAVTGTNEGDDDVPALTYTLNDNGKSKQVTTYGERITRTPNQDLWGGTGNKYYDMEYGIGFYEYFKLCDKLGASAVPVLNCGLSCQGGGASNPRSLLGRHGKGIEDYIQDAFDLVCFALGDVNSSDANEAKWAKIRKNLGHEEPFKMEYLGIGNEQWGIYYTEYYEKFVEAFAEAKKSNPIYGQVQIIVGNGTQLSDCEGYQGSPIGTAKTAARLFRSSKKTITNLSEYGVHDHHYYRNYSEFFELSTLYDSYTREDPDKYYVFVGEYSANADRRQDNTPMKQVNNSWLTALSEAAYMTGLERNSDIVKLAAYAPMFASTLSSDNQWAADMMFYTNTELMLTPNYYVQQLFMRNQGNTYIPGELTAESGFERTFTVSEGTASYQVEKLYFSVSVEEKTGDIIVKIVNGCGDPIKVNVDLGSQKVKGTADVTYLQCDDLDAVNTVKTEKVSPATKRLGVSATFGYTAEKYSVSVLRIPTKK